MRRLLPLFLFAAACGTDSGAGNLPPSLTIDVSSEISAVVGEDVVRITVTAEDPEGGAVTLSLLNPPERSDFQANGPWGVFTWDPISSDVTSGQPRELIFVATDSVGLSTEKVVVVVILAGNGVPKFLNSSSVLHNVANGGPVSFEVKVRDDDSNTVSLRMPEGFAPDGAELTKTSEFSGQFGWIPTPEQIQQRVHTVRFVANDGVNEPVNQDVTIILKKDTQATDTPDSSGCLFEDIVSWEPVRAQRGTSDHGITARLKTGDHGYDRLTLNYTNGDAFNDYALMWESLDMRAEGDTFRASIPNTLGPEVQQIFFEICAINDDPTEDQGYPVLCGPSSLYDSFLVYPPTATECQDDPYDYIDDFESASDVPTDTWLYRRLCAGTDDYFAVGLGTNQEASVYITYPTWAKPTVEVYDIAGTLLETAPVSTCGGFTEIKTSNTGAPTKRFIKVVGSENATDVGYQVIGSVLSTSDPSSCIDAMYEPNEGAENATVVSTASAMFSGLEICRPDDQDVFAFEAQAGQQIRVKADFQNSVADLDVKLFAPDQEVNQQSPAIDYSLGLESVEEIVHVATQTGQYKAMVYSVDNANRYSLLIEVGAAPVTCQDVDAFEPNDFQFSATYLSDGTTTGLKACSGQDDWYSFLVIDAFQETYDVRLTPVGAAGPGDFEVEIWDVFGKVADGSILDGKVEAKLFPLASGDHYIVVRASKEAQYDLELAVSF